MVTRFVRKFGVYVLPTTCAVVEELVEVVLVPDKEDVAVPVERLVEPPTVLHNTLKFNVNSKTEGSGIKVYVPFDSLNVSLDVVTLQVISSNSISLNCKL